MNKDIIRQSINVITLVIALLVNWAANALPLNGQTSAEISDRLPIYFVPAGYVFAIWGVIYIFLIGFTIYQALPSQRENSILRKIGYWFAISNLANAGWLFAFHYNQFPISMLLMIVLLVSLMMIYVLTQNGKVRLSAIEKWVIHIPFSVYLGWITVATVANASYVLYDLGWGGFGISDPMWATIMIAIATIISLTMIIRFGDIAYITVIAWAFLGIYSKQDPRSAMVGTSALLMTAILILAIATKRFIEWQDTTEETASYPIPDAS